MAIPLLALSLGAATAAAGQPGPAAAAGSGTGTTRGFGVFIDKLPAEDPRRRCSERRRHFDQVRIVGSPAALDNWPGMVALRSTSVGGPHQYLCGGTLISPHWVLTAAHCTEDVFKSADGRWVNGDRRLQVVLGTDNLIEVTDERVREVDDIIRHPEYRRLQASSQGYDIALLHLAEPWSPDGALFSTLSLDRQTDNGVGPMPMVAGFGHQFPVSMEDEDPSARARPTQALYTGAADGVDLLVSVPGLMEAALPVQDLTVCQDRYPKQVIDNRLICAGFAEGGRPDACKGDSGGPLVAFDRYNCPYQIGLVSWGDGCAQAGTYGFYTRVSAFKDFLLENVPEGELRVIASEDLSLEVVDKGGKTVQIPETSVAQADVLLDELSKLLPGTNGRVSVEILPSPGDRNRVPLGSVYRFRVNSEVSGRLLIVDVDAKGKFTQIFPNQHTNTKAQLRIEAGLPITVPSAEWGFYGFEAIPPDGESRLLVMVVPDGFRETGFFDAAGRERGFAPVSDPGSYSANLLNQVRLARGESDAPADDWGLDVLRFEVVKSH